MTRQFQIEWYCSHGWHLIPTWGLQIQFPFVDWQGCACHARSTCSQAGKHPFRPWKARTRAYTPAELARLEDEHHRATVENGTATTYGLNYAVALGRSGLIAVDVDNHPGGADGDAHWRALQAQYGEITPTVRDSRGHYLFSPPGAFQAAKTAIQLAPGVELLSGTAAADHLLFISPSNHRDGSPYQWLPGYAPWEHVIAELPGWIADLATERTKERANPRPDAHSASSPVVNLPSPGTGNAPSTFERARRYVLRMPVSISGQRGHDAAMRVARVLVWRFDLSQSDAFAVMAEWNAGCQPPWSDGELRHKLDQADRTPDPKGRPRGDLRDSVRPEREREESKKKDIHRRIRTSDDQENIRCPNSSIQGNRRIRTSDQGQNIEPAEIGDAHADPTGPIARLARMWCWAGRRECPANYHVALKRKPTGEPGKGPAGLTLRLFCSRWTCWVCYPRKRRLLGWHLTACAYYGANTGQPTWEQLQADRDRMWSAEELAEDRRTLLSVWTGSIDQWSAITKRINRADGDYARITVGDRSIVLTTTDLGGVCDRLPREEATARLLQAIALIPQASGRPWASSRRWAIPDNRSFEWEAIGFSNSTSLDIAEDNLNAFGMRGRRSEAEEASQGVDEGIYNPIPDEDAFLQYVLATMEGRRVDEAPPQRFDQPDLQEGD